jgi:hypothetical protein
VSGRHEYVNFRLTWASKIDFTREFLSTRGVTRPHGMAFKKT